MKIFIITKNGGCISNPNVKKLFSLVQDEIKEDDNIVLQGEYYAEVANLNRKIAKKDLIIALVPIDGGTDIITISGESLIEFNDYIKGKTGRTYDMILSFEEERKDL